LQMLADEGVQAPGSARLNTETPGSAIDRLSIMSLRTYHFEEQLARDDADDAHRTNVGAKLARCKLQHNDLARSLTELLEDICSPRSRLQVYQKMKMKNVPTLNPYVYRTARVVG